MTTNTTTCVDSQDQGLMRVRRLAWSWACGWHAPFFYHEHQGTVRLGWAFGPDPRHTLWVVVGQAKDSPTEWRAAVCVRRPIKPNHTLADIIPPARPYMRAPDPITALDEAATSALGATKWQREMRARGAPIGLLSLLWMIRQYTGSHLGLCS